MSAGAVSAASTFELPWPPSACSPNASSQGNWWRKSTAAKKYRGECLLTLKLQSVPLLFVDGPVMLDMIYCPPTRRLSDLDNLLSRSKQGIDALAEVMGVDDKIFEYTLRRGDPVKHGKVLVSISGIQ